MVGSDGDETIGWAGWRLQRASSTCLHQGEVLPVGALHGHLVQLLQLAQRRHRPRRDAHGLEHPLRVVIVVVVVVMVGGLMGIGMKRRAGGSE